ncbi:EamA-like transporter family protein [Kordia sp. SMS9]|uniref:DMT family transporter n=1 Tax=Kordia sp. SMS9 TaxID=2282170 RepID=UPI000E0D3730|nr:DMT family transporter [Kordia sp. SMS9]AXG70872.1 EamA-like transporter family protein [Kordia sp. SMS9]
MLGDKLKNYLHLHLLVFIAGFTAILGKLITIEAIPLVWFRMLLAGILMFAFIKVSKINLNISLKTFSKFAVAGIVVALHWITFFGAIDVSNVSITLVMFSTGGFFASFIEPIIYRRKIIWYEIIFGIIVIIGVSIIMNSEFKYINGIILGIISAFLSALFSVLNGKFVEKHDASTISFYEFICGVAFISIYLAFAADGFSKENFFILSTNDWLYIFILASVCTAYAFIASTHIMRYISPYTVVLTYNLEIIYGIILEFIIFPEEEKMGSGFYYGSLLVIATVLANGILKNRRKIKSASGIDNS